MVIFSARRRICSQERGLGRKRKDSDYVSVVEACYRDIEADDAWLAQLFEVAQPVLDLGGGLGLSLVQEGPHARAVTLSHGVGRINDMLQLSWPVIQQLDDGTYREFFYPREPVTLASTLVAAFQAPARKAFSSLMEHAQASDLLGMLGYPAPGWAFAMFVAVGDAPLTPALRATLRRLRIHIEASLRLRMLSSSEAVAVIRPDGTLAHVQTDLVEPSSYELLEAHASAIERARSARERASPHRALAVWRALVEGRWSLVERIDRDGQRNYHAFENAPHAYAYRALTETEALVLELSLQGLVGKEIAYETGLSQSRISDALRLAAERLGFSDRNQLLRVAARLRDGAQSGSVELTLAEQEVLGLVRQGLSNAAIARARETSIHTVANQLASLLRKTGARSRRGLLLSDS
jgi:DNA-binding NarL/FixJ family response regulator